MTALNVSLTHDLPAFTLQMAADAPAGRLALFGPSGAGKTTVLKAIAGLIQPKALRLQLGSTVAIDTVHGPCPPVHQRDIGFVFQEARLFPHLSVAENICYSQKAAADLADVLRMDDLRDRSVHSLSGGEARRVAIARALAAANQLYLLDEPYAGIDHKTAADLRRVLTARFAAYATPFVLVSHSLDDVLVHDCHVALIDRGQMLAQGAPEDVFNTDAGRALLSDADAALHGGPVTVWRATSQQPEGKLSVYVLANGAELRIPQSTTSGQYIKVRASDVSIVLGLPSRTSVLNVLPATVMQINAENGLANVDLDMGAGLVLKARITSYSVSELELAPGRPVFAQVKSAALVSQEDARWQTVLKSNPKSPEKSGR